MENSSKINYNELIVNNIYNLHITYELSSEGYGPPNDIRNIWQGEVKITNIIYNPDEKYWMKKYTIEFSVINGNEDPTWFINYKYPLDKNYDYEYTYNFYNK
jgi:hypothetical protein